MFKKIDLTTIIILIIAFFAIQQLFFKKEELVKDKTISTVEKTGEVKKVTEKVIRDTVYIEIEVPGRRLPVKKEIIVDSLYKSKYELAVKENDTLKAKNLFLESISLDTWYGNLIDDKDIKIDGKFLTRGKLLEYDINYKIKSDTIRYKPEVVYRHPKFSFMYGIDAELPSSNVGNEGPSIGAHGGVQTKNGNIYKIGYNSRGNITIGFSKTLKLF
jgi:hypothetical protein